MRFLALGDSYTIGEGVGEQDRWPAQLTRLLRARGIAVDDPEIIARTAWTTDELSDAISGATPAGFFDLVTLMVGVNDQYRSRAVRTFADEYARLLELSSRFAGGDASRVVAISIPDWGATPFAQGRDRVRISTEIDAYNARACELVRAAGVKWMDVTPTSRDMAADPDLAVADGLHPSPEMYRRWAALLLPVAESILSRPLR